MTLSKIMLFSIILAIVGCKGKDSNAKLKIEKREYRVNEKFKYSIEPADIKKFAIKWGGSEIDEIEKTVGEFKYEEAGKYLVKLIVNNKMTDSFTINVLTEISTIDTSNRPKIVASALDVFQGDEVTFTDNTPGANDPTKPLTQTKWTYGDVDGVDKGRVAKHKFIVPGKYTVRASYEKGGPLNSSGSVEINVKPKMVIPPPVKTPVKTGGGGKVLPPPIPTIPKLSDNELKVRFQQISDAGKCENEWLRNLLHFLCDNQSVAVDANGENMNLDKYIKKISFKKPHINSVQQIRDPHNQCVTKIIIN